MIMKSDIKDFTDDIAKEIDLDEVCEYSIERLCTKLIELGIFKDMLSIKLYLGVKPLWDIKNEEESYPITYEKGFSNELEYDDIANEDQYNLNENFIKRHE